MFNRKSKLRNRTDNSPGRSRYTYYSVPSDSSVRENRDKDYYASRLNPKSGWWKHAPTMIAIAVIVISVGYSLSLNSNPKIVQVAEANDLFLQGVDTYQAAAQKQFKNSLLNTNKVTVNISGITRELKQQFPELSDVSVTVPMLGHRPLIYITPSQPTLILESHGDAYILNDRAIAVIKANNIPNLAKLKLPTLVDKTNLPIKLGDRTLPANDLDFIISVVRQFKAKHVVIKSLTLPPKPNELDVKVEGQDYTIKMDILGDAKGQTGSYLAVKDHLTKTHQRPRQYIDVRVPGRIYYR